MELPANKFPSVVLLLTENMPIKASSVYSGDFPMPRNLHVGDITALSPVLRAKAQQTFVDGFARLYRGKEVAMGFSNHSELRAWLASVFETWETKAAADPSGVRLILHIADADVAGVAFAEDNTNFVYMAQLAVSPNAQHQSIVAQLVQQVSSAFGPAKPIKFVARKTSVEGLDLYCSLGAVGSDYTRPEYDPNMYDGFVIALK